MHPQIAELRQTRDALVGEARTILERSGDGALSDDDQQRFTEIETELAALKGREEQLTELIRVAGLPGHTEHGDGARGGRRDDRDTPPPADTRSRALSVLEQQERTAPHLTRGILDEVARNVTEDDSDLFARWVNVAGDEHYLRAFHALARNPQFGQYEWSEAERAAFGRAQQLQRAMGLADAAGGFMVPFSLDPAIVLTNAGTSNSDLRRAFTVKTIATDAWNGVTSAGVTAEWKAEAVEVADASPTLAQPSIVAHKGDAFIPFSVEIGGDAANFAAEMSALLVDGKQRLEAVAFINGTGVGQPNGLVTAAVAAAKTINSATADTYAAADLYALKAALPARWRARAAWLANENILDKTRQFATGSGPQSAFWADFGDDTPPRLLGKPVFESSEMDGTVDATANNYVVAYGDLKAYYVVDRVGTTIELVPHLFGTNRRPTLERGYVMWFRTGGDLVVPDAVRVLNA